nr:RES domain-containing protein [Ensifer adhaerens]
MATDVAKSYRQRLARAWSLAFREHQSAPAGMNYPSRLNGHTNLAIFDSAISKTPAVRVVALIGASGLAPS